MRRTDNNLETFSKSPLVKKEKASSFFLLLALVLLVNIWTLASGWLVVTFNKERCFDINNNRIIFVMSTEAQAVEEACASCGKVAVDDGKLKICTACNLVKYCSVDCQKNHRPQHKKACKKRMAEIRDNRLFTQPEESSFGECPICCLP